MGQIQVEKNVGGIEGLHIITPAVHGDNRGYFTETYNQKDMHTSKHHLNYQNMQYEHFHQDQLLQLHIYPCRPRFQECRFPEIQLDN